MKNQKKIILKKKVKIKGINQSIFRLLIKFITQKIKNKIIKTKEINKTKSNQISHFLHQKMHPPIIHFLQKIMEPPIIYFLQKIMHPPIIHFQLLQILQIILFQINHQLKILWKLDFNKIKLRLIIQISLLILDMEIIYKWSLQVYQHIN